MNQEVEAIVATVSEEAIMKNFRKGIVSGLFITTVIFGTGIMIGKAKEKRRIVKDIVEKGEFTL